MTDDPPQIGLDYEKVATVYYRDGRQREYKGNKNTVAADVRCTGNKYSASRQPETASIEFPTDWFTSPPDGIGVKGSVYGDGENDRIWWPTACKNYCGRQGNYIDCGVLHVSGDASPFACICGYRCLPTSLPDYKGRQTVECIS